MTDVSSYEFIKKLQVFPFVEAIFLFGSRTQNKHSKFSDIDLAISCPKATTQEWQKVLDIVDNADTLLKIDCVRYDEIVGQKFKAEIDQTKQVIYDKSRRLKNT